MTSLRIILERTNERAAEEQTEARETTRRSYRDPKVRPIILSNRIYRRRYGI
ncbi:hypothetical protein [Streptomyces sp. SID4982]|uniref:hypothetical protein n=1 Tax=Streptomyces sp. SID4982 TaxID=2690291 RepID=UPI00136B5D06|nr:hypothetical protein [Streptomyces sp. SID4982]MYS15042.1 hypothetical protein [Streptomyces sp. SID4982]